MRIVDPVPSLWPWRTKAGCGLSRELSERWSRTEEPPLPLYWRLPDDMNPLLLLPADEKFPEALSVPLSSSESTVESCELHWCGCACMCCRLDSACSAHEPGIAKELGGGRVCTTAADPNTALVASCVKTEDIEAREGGLRREVAVRSDSLDRDL